MHTAGETEERFHKLQNEITFHIHSLPLGAKMPIGGDVLNKEK